jgi:hypothetical protein
MKRPPPVLDDNLWDEIATEVKRKSMLDPTTSAEALDDDELQDEPETGYASGLLVGEVVDPHGVHREAPEK